MNRVSVNEKVHILYFIHDLAPFGAQRIILYTVKYLEKEKFRVTVCSFWGEETLAPEFIKYGAEVILLRAKRLYDPFAWIRFIRLLRLKRPDIIQASIPELGVAVRLLTPFFKSSRIIFLFQNPLFNEQFGWRVLNRLTIGLCDTIAYVSFGIADEIQKECPSIRNRSFVVPNGILPDKFLVPYPDEVQHLRREWDIKENEKVLCCVGRISKQKAQDILIEAMQILVKKDVPVKLVIVGDGDMESELKQLVKSSDLQERILFLGRRSDIPQILSAIDIYVAPSRWEGFNIALSEAMASRKPCIASVISGHKDLLDDKKTGIAVRPDNAEEVVSAVECILNQDKEAEQMAIRAQERVKNNFSAEKMAQKYQDLYLNLISKTEKSIKR